MQLIFLTLFNLFPLFNQLWSHMLLINQITLAVNVIKSNIKMRFFYINTILKYTFKMSSGMILI